MHLLGQAILASTLIGKLERMVSEIILIISKDLQVVNRDLLKCITPGGRAIKQIVKKTIMSFLTGLGLGLH